MFYTDIGLTQYEMHDKVSFLDRYNTDMRTITSTVTVASGEIKRVEEESKDRDTGLEQELDDIEERVSTVEDKIPPIVASVSVVSGRVEVVEMKTAALEVTTTSISDKLIEHITTSTSMMAGIVEEIKTGDAALDLKIDADRERIAVNETKIAENAADIEALQNSDSALEPRVEANENAIEALQQVDSTQAQAIKAEHDTNVTQDSAIAANNTKTNANATKIATLEQDVEELKSHNATKVKLPVFFDKAHLVINGTGINMNTFTLESDNPRELTAYKIQLNSNMYTYTYINGSIAYWSATEIDLDLAEIKEPFTFGVFDIEGLTNLYGSTLTISGELRCQGSEGDSAKIFLTGSIAIEIFEDRIPVVIMTELPNAGHITKIIDGYIALSVS